MKNTPLLKIIFILVFVILTSFFLSTVKVLSSKNTQLLQQFCFYNSSRYNNNKTFNALDKCNVCKCYNGIVNCTTFICHRDQTPQATPYLTPFSTKTNTICEYMGEIYQDGEYADPPCNSIFCKNGQIYESARPCQTSQ